MFFHIGKWHNQRCRLHLKSLYTEKNQTDFREDCLYFI